MPLPATDQQLLRTRKPSRPLSVDGVQQRPNSFKLQPTAVKTRPHNSAAAVAMPALSQPVARPARPMQQPMRPAQPKAPEGSVARPGRPYQMHPDDAPRPSFWQRVQLPLLIMVGMVAGFFVQSLVFGIAIIVTYGVVATILHVPSRITFALAFISLLTVPALLLIKSNVELASNFATYTFLLLVIGVIALSIEARPQERKRTRRRGR
jgi:hypothetical protein